MNEYIYEPLKSPGHIRLVYLHPTTDGADGPIQCNIVQALLDSNPVYEALSYTWDLTDEPQNPLEDREIFCDGGTLLIRPNLFSALRQLRANAHPHTSLFQLVSTGLNQFFLPTGSSRCLWIDAICINQKDTTGEKNHQVQIMDRIFANSHRTLVWLGEPQPSDATAFDLMTRLSNQLRLKLANGESYWDNVERFDEPLNGTILQLVTSSGWNSVASLFCRRWFSRVWIVQETVLSKNILFLCGELSLDWSVILHVCDYVMGALRKFQGVNIGRAWIGCRAVYQMRIMKRDLARGANPDIMHIFQASKNFGATNSRDKLYAFLGMISDRSDSIFNPNYDTPEWILFTQWTAYSLKKDNKRFAYAALSYSRIPGSVPSWVLNWGTPDVYYYPFVAPGYYCAMEFMPRALQFTQNDSIIHLQGVIIGQVMAVGGVKLNLPLNYETIEIKRYMNRLRKHRQFIRESERVVSECFSHEMCFAEAFWRTLICNDSYGNGPIDQTMAAKLGESFKVYRKGIEMRLEDCSDSLNLEKFKKLYSQCYRFAESFNVHRRQRVFGVTKKDGFGMRMGMFPEYAQVGDIVCAFAGAHTPHVIRKRTEDDNSYQFIGECYVHGFMYGELAEIPGIWDMLVDIALH